MFRDRAKRIEEQLPVWGRRLYDVALAVPEASTILNAWRRQESPSLRRFTVLVDAPTFVPSETGDGGDDSEQDVAEAQQAATLLLALPWELIHDRTGYLFQGVKGVRVRRRLPDADVAEPQPGEPPVRVLLVSPRPDDERAAYLDHRVSARPVVDALAQLGDLARLTLLDPPTLPALEAELLRAHEDGKPYHVVHFDGHGVYDRRHGWGALCFEDPRDAGQTSPVKDEKTGQMRGRRTAIVPAEKLAAVLRDSDLPLFVLEACQSAQAENDPTASVAGRLLACGVTSVVAMSHSVLVETARRFVTIFYRELIRGRRIGQAMLERPARVVSRPVPRPDVWRRADVAGLVRHRAVSGASGSGPVSADRRCHVAGRGRASPADRTGRTSVAAGSLVRGPQPGTAAGRAAAVRPAAGSG